MNASDNSFDDLIGIVLQDRYRVLSCIGRGGMGVVYEVEHVLIGKRLALKTLDPAFSRDREILTRFHLEAKAAAAIGDEHIIDIIDMGQSPTGSPYIVMELLEGRSLSSEIKSKGPMSISRAIDIATQCCEALGSAHQKGIVHRDVKPDNIFLTRRQDRSDFVKILDFGVSKFHEASIGLEGGSMTKTGAAIGTPYYMSPEQAHGLKIVDARTDVYAMGVVLYEMLIGQVPFIAPTYPLLMVKILQDNPPSMTELRSDIPQTLQQVVFRALRKQHLERYRSITELAEALRPFDRLSSPPELTDSGVQFVKIAKPDTTPGSWERETKQKTTLSSKKIFAVLGGLAVAVVLAMLGLFVFRIIPTDSHFWGESDEHLVTPAPEPLPMRSAVSPSTPLANETKVLEPGSTRNLQLPPDPNPISAVGTVSSQSEGRGRPAKPKPRPSFSKKATTRKAKPSSTGKSVAPKSALPLVDKGAINIKNPSESKAPFNALKEKTRSTDGKSDPSTERREESDETVRDISTADEAVTNTAIGNGQELKPEIEPKPEPKAALTRKVAIINHRRAAVSVTVNCGEVSVTTDVSARGRKMVEVPKLNCKVGCKGVGQPSCPLALKAQNAYVDIR